MYEMRRQPTWEWVPPPGWPIPPHGWTPPPGWQPDPSWPPAPAGHDWWRVAPAARRRRWIPITIVCASVLIVGGCVAASTIGGPCFFDPPPGDYGALPVINDTTSSVSVAEWCDTTLCAPQDGLRRVSPGGRASVTIESCSGGKLGVFKPGSETPMSCVAEPTENADFRLPPVHVSNAAPCSGAP
jgi:hypothetical protein